MRARARIEVDAGPDGRYRMVDVRSEPPLSLRRTLDRVVVVGSAAGPVGGDELELDVVVGPGARLDLGTAAATVVWPGDSGRRSSTRTQAEVGRGGHLTWRPEPLISVGGSHHLLRTEVTLAGDASCAIVDEVVLGRSGEPGGHLEIEIRVTRDVRALVHHTERLGPQTPGWGSAVTVGTARVLVTAVVVGPPSGTPATTVGADASAAWLPLAEDAAVALAVGDDRIAARRGLSAVAPTDCRLFAPAANAVAG